MMASASPRIPPLLSPPPQPQLAQKALYVGPFVDELGEILSKHIGQIDIRYTRRVSEAIEWARASKFDVVVVDQRDDALATRLIVPLMSGIGQTTKLVVISNLKDVSSYLAVPGVARVISAPLRETQVLRVLGLKPVEKNVNKATVDTAPPPVEKKFSFRPFAWAMTLVSNIYKRTAFVLLVSLFSAFAFYGMLIAFFLISSRWAAPLTLVRGHELVNKVEAEIAQLMVNKDLAQQRATDAQLEKLDGERTLAESVPVVKGSIRAIATEIRTRQGQANVLSTNIKRLKKTMRSFAKVKSAESGSTSAAELFNKRLIDKNTYESSTLASLELAQRGDMIANEIETSSMELESLVSSIEMLRSLQASLEGKAQDEPSAAPPDLLLLAKQAMDARIAIEASKAKIASAEKTLSVLANSTKVLESQIIDLRSSPAGRAIEKRIDVVFVPYTNLNNFKSGTKLFSCKLTIVFCSEAGRFGQHLPGETTFTHPFFGKPIRGIFAEITLINPDAASREIIHAKNKPLFF